MTDGMSLWRNLIQFLLELLAVFLGLFRGGAVMGGYGVNSDRVNRAINADAAGQTINRFDRVFLVEINHLGAESASHPQPRFFGVNGEDPPRAHELRAGDRE